MREGPAELGRLSVADAVEHDADDGRVPTRDAPNALSAPPRAADAEDGRTERAATGAAALRAPRADEADDGRTAPARRGRG